MLIKKLNIKKLLIIFAFVIVFAMLIISPQKYSKSVTKGVSVWFIYVFPTLFPYILMTKLINSSNVINSNFKPIEKFSQKLFRVSSISFYIFLTSAICGYPVGAKTISELHESHSISDIEAHRLSTFCCTSGAMFIMGTVSILLKSVKYSVIILIAHLVSALINGLIFRNYGIQKTKSRMIENKQFGYKTNSDINYTTLKTIKVEEGKIYDIKKQHFCSSNTIRTLNTDTKDNNEKLCPPKNKFLIADDVSSAIKSILMIGGFISLSYLLVDILQDLKILEALNFLIGKIFILLHINPELSNPFCCGLFEITRGIVQMSEFSDIKTTTCLITFLISFSGISIILQCVAFLQKAGIRIKFFLLSKISHAVLSSLLCLILVTIF